MCGIAGIVHRREAVRCVARGLYALQHRGHDSCGVAYIDSNTGLLEAHSASGAVADVLPNEYTSRIESTMAIGQNLYTTYGSKHSQQPFSGRFWDAKGNDHHLALSHNGQLCGIDRLRKKYPAIYRTHSDSEVIFSLLPHMPGETIVEKIRHLLNELDGAFSLLMIADGQLVAVRDSRGFRPLIMGTDQDGGIAFASEINAFDLMGVHFERQVRPGEMIVVSPDSKVTSIEFKQRSENLSQCVFEHIYFARPDNQLFGKASYSTQIALGRQTARELKGTLQADLVMAVPDSANIATLGFSKESGFPLQVGLLRHHYAARTFITRGQNNREEAVRLKFNIIKDVIKGKRLILGDDSLVRSTTSRIVISMLRQGGAREVHMVLFSPPILNPCVYGINMASKDELIANIHNGNLKAIAQSIGADSVRYLSLEGLRAVMGTDAHDYCYACMNGEYPVEPKISEKFTS